MRFQFETRNTLIMETAAVIIGGAV